MEASQSPACAGTAALASDGPSGVDVSAGDVTAGNSGSGLTPNEIEQDVAEPEVAATPEASVPVPSEQDVANAQAEVDGAFI